MPSSRSAAGARSDSSCSGPTGTASRTKRCASFASIRCFSCEPPTVASSAGRRVAKMPIDDPQFEGLVVDKARGILYAAQEATGIWSIPLDRRLPSVVEVSASRLFEPTRSFGQAYWAIPDDDEFSCEAEAPEILPPGTVVSPGAPSAAGARLEADAEGLAIYYGRGSSGYLIASSQGDDTFHAYDRANPRRHIGSFQIEGYRRDRRPRCRQCARELGFSVRAFRGAERSSPGPGFRRSDQRLRVRQLDAVQVDRLGEDRGPVGPADQHAPESLTAFALQKHWVPQ